MLNNSRDNDHLQSYRHKRNYLCIGEKKNSCLIYNQKVKSWFNCEWWNVIWNGIGGNSILMFNFSSSVIIRNIWNATIQYLFRSSYKLNRMFLLFFILICSNRIAIKNLIIFTEMVKSYYKIFLLASYVSILVLLYTKIFGKTDNMSKYETSFLVNVYLLMLTLFTIIYQ